MSTINVVQDFSPAKLPKRPRLKGFSYCGNFGYFITICANQKEKVFLGQEVVNLVYNVLTNEAMTFGFTIYAYCFMPDHLHLLVIGQTQSDLKKFIKSFKQKSGFIFKEKYRTKLWQPSYYDHILRKEETIKDIALYVFSNPVRKNLVSDFRKYPFSGSTVFNLNELL